MDTTTEIILHSIDKDSIAWDIRSYNDNKLSLLTVVKDSHLFKALKIHANLLEVNFKDPDLSFLNPFFYRSIITRKVIEAESDKVPKYLVNQFNDSILLGLNEYLNDETENNDLKD